MSPSGQARPCPVCGYPEAHAPTCPAAELARLRQAVPRYLREWRRGDPRAAMAGGSSLWVTHVGPTWMLPMEVRTLGLLPLMRRTIQARIALGDWLATGRGTAEERLDAHALLAASEAVAESTSSPDVRSSPAEQDSAVTAEEFWGDPAWRGQEGLGPDVPRSGAPEPREGAPEATRPIDRTLTPTDDSGGDAEVLAPEERAVPAFTSGKAAGWRWWVVRDPAGDLLAYDNRPTLERWDEAVCDARDSALSYFGKGSPHVDGAVVRHVGPRPDLVQGSVPMAVVHAAAEGRLASALFGADGTPRGFSEARRRLAWEEAAERADDPIDVADYAGRVRDADPASGDAPPLS